MYPLQGYPRLALKQIPGLITSKVKSGFSLMILGKKLLDNLPNPFPKIKSGAKAHN